MRPIFFYGFIILFIIFVSIKLIYFDNPPESKFSELAEQKVFLKGLIIDEPDPRENNTIYIFKPDGSDELIRVFANPYPQLLYGDYISVSGVIQKPENFKNENGIEFDYKNFLSKDEIYTQLFFPKIEVLEKGKINNLKSYLFKIKTILSLSISRVIPSPQAELAAGLLLGTKQALGSVWLEKFRIVGLIHIIVLSGYNITIIAEAIRHIFSFLPKRTSFVFTVFSIFSFAIMTGGSATIIRASIMAILTLISRYYDTKYSVNKALFFAGFLMILQNPKILLYDPGFQLSFVATIGLIHISPLISRIIFFITNKFGIREILASTIATQISVLPLLIKMTGEVSIVSILVNALVLPIISITMLFSFITSLLVFINIKLALLPGLISHLLLKYVFIVVDYFSKFKFAVLNLTNIFKVVLDHFPI